jgi:hypothetical protein
MQGASDSTQLTRDLNTGSKRTWCTVHGCQVWWERRERALQTAIEGSTPRVRVCGSSTCIFALPDTHITPLSASLAVLLNSPFSASLSSFSGWIWMLDYLSGCTRFNRTSHATEEGIQANVVHGAQLLIIWRHYKVQTAVGVRLPASAFGVIILKRTFSHGALFCHLRLNIQSLKMTILNSHPGSPLDIP